MISYKKYRQDVQTFQSAVAKKKLILYGAGFNAVKFLNRNENLAVSYICDSNERRVGHTFMGIDICSPELLLSETPQDIVILITPDNNNDIVKRISEISEEIGLFFYPLLYNTVMPDYITFDVSDYSTYFFDHQEELHETMELLEDDISKNILMQISEGWQRFWLDFSDIYLPNQYFLPEMFETYRRKNEIVIDAGACDGDTVCKFIDLYGENLSKIYAFEPMPENLDELARVATRNPQHDIKIMPYALLDEDKTTEGVSYQTRPGWSGLEEETNRPHRDDCISKRIPVMCRKLDSIIPSDEQITLIKMDIEGAEMAALRGGAQLIKKHKPSLAISIYHSAFDCINIPKYIKSLVPEYKLYVRHHSPTWPETVLYAFV